MVSSNHGSGLKELIFVKAKESRFGAMGLNMKDGGRETKLVEKEDLYMQMETYIQENGKKTKHTDMESTLI